MRMNYLTSNEIADRLGLSRSQVNRLAAQGKLKAVKVAGVWMFEPLEKRRAS